MTISKVNKAYLAGVVDSDGCITIIRGYGSSKKNKWGFLRILVGSLWEKFVLYLKESSGGLGTISRGVTPKGKGYFTWKLSSKQARDLLKEITPYLVLKRREAELVLSLNYNQGRLTKTEIKNRNYAFSKLRELKKSKGRM